MDDGERDDARLTDDLRFTPVEGAAEGFARTTAGAVSYVPVVSTSGVLGYLWWSDAENAAGFEPRPSAGNAAFNAASYWIARVRGTNVRERLPSHVVTELREGSGGSAAGHIAPDAPAQAENHQAVRAIARE
ncbi:hypothetical protein ACIBFB_23835 [Nocardiopsis sp. NPDC050513]|uniref:hypothetical protein n=1 Tax=Nocardiopsis sp. NPDC050513 TaxID=3364338 RepID=UPI00378D1E40